ncbi:MAG: hypothetical protein R2845_07640 [Thermomicrobiales bacterium]
MMQAQEWQWRYSKAIGNFATWRRQIVLAWRSRAYAAAPPASTRYGITLRIRQADDPGARVSAMTAKRIGLPFRHCRAAGWSIRLTDNLCWMTPVPAHQSY